MGGRKTTCCGAGTWASLLDAARAAKVDYTYSRGAARLFVVVRAAGVVEVLLRGKPVLLRGTDRLLVSEWAAGVVCLLQRAQQG